MSHLKNRLPLLLFCLVGWVSAQQTPPPQKDYAPYPPPDSGYVTDLAGVLSLKQKDEMNSWLYTAEMKTKLEVAVVIIRSIQDYPGTANRSIESFAKGLFDKYGIGNMPANNGVLLLVAVDDRKARIELGAAYGRSRDGDANRIMQTKIIPHFRQGQYAEGIQTGVKGILREFGGFWIIPGWVKILILGLIVVLTPISISMFRNGKRGWGWICAGFLMILFLVLLRLLGSVVQHLPSGSSEGGFGGGFGGGFSGGGGATGSW